MKEERYDDVVRSRRKLIGKVRPEMAVRPENLVGAAHEEAHAQLTGAGYKHHPVFPDVATHHYHHPRKKHSVHLLVDPTGSVENAMAHDCGMGY